ncbi:MAG: cysteine desulfurase family protein [Fimbriimonadaceae bacterium]|nr:MAG: Cysteine sulfinate desulfinase/cysteine desulfurase [Armatimonadetes bacterium OLB18]WKZ80267.1 MAG: cysteine desulfurase family protein [Fimbriimonadaceae bacterium]
MHPLERYFDHAASTPVDPAVLEAMLPFLQEEAGNAHSIHTLGLKARKAVEAAREQVALLVGAEFPSEIVFTSGASEANNTVIRFLRPEFISPFEHSSVRVPACNRGASMLSNKGTKLVPPESGVRAIACMAVNNEMGAVFDLPPLRRSCGALHCDATQLVGKLDADFQNSAFEYAAFSSHKMYGPKGVGALYVRSGSEFEPLIEGGGQESGFRSGTLNVPGIVGLGRAAEVCRARMSRDRDHALRLRHIVLEQLSEVPDLTVNGGEACSPFILSLSFWGIEGETLVLDLDRRGFAVSAASACKSSSHEEPSVVTALHSDPAWSRGTIRISFGRRNTDDASAALGLAVKESVGTLRELAL